MGDIKLNQWVKSDGKRHAPGSILLNISDELAKTLVKDGAASHFHEENAKESGTVVSKNNELNQYPDVTVDEQELQRKEMDDNFTLDELKEDAPRFGIEYPSNVKKSELISKILKQGKAEAFLNLLEDSE